MNISKTYEALNSLLGTSGPDLVFPDVIELPDLIHTLANDEVRQTVRDGREHSTGFSYNTRREAWHSGPSFSGAVMSEAPGMLRANVGRMSILAHTIWRPTIAMHTHPHPDPKAFERSTLNLEPNLPSSEIQSRLAHAEASFALPGISDLANYFMRSGGTLGDMVCSVQGTFLLLKRRPEQDVSLYADCLDIFQPYPRRRQISERYETSAMELLQPLADTELSLETLQAAYRQIVARTVMQRYVCYWSTEPLGKMLARVNA